MEKAAYRKKQYKVLDTFYKEYYKKSNVQWGYHFATGIFVFVLGILCAMPYQGMAEDAALYRGMAVMAGNMITIMYLSSYQNCVNEMGRVTPLYTVIKYLPVSADILRRYRFKKLLRFQGRVYLVMQLLQLVVSIGFCRYEFVLENIRYPLLTVLVVPLGIAGIIMFVDK